MWIAICILILVAGTSCNDCAGTENTNEVLHIDPVLVKTTPHGKLYHITNDRDTIRIVVVEGTAREQGKAIGQLLKKEITETLAALRETCIIIAKWYTKDSPKFIKDLVMWLLEPTIRFMQNLTWLFTRPYTPQHFFDEMRGEAEGAELEYMDLLRGNLFLELIKAACSLVGVWGPASYDGNVYFLRALDWESDGPVTKYPLITVYHSTEPGSIPFATFGYTGLVGSFTALNAHGLAIAEKHWDLTMFPEVERSVVGTPWHFVIRDVAQFHDTLDSAIKSLTETRRTCSVFLGIGSAKDNSFRGLRYSADRLEVYDDKSAPQNDNKHWLIEGANYVDEGVQPTKNDCVASLLQAGHGRVDMPYLYQQVAAKRKTGDCQVLVMDLTRMKLYFAYSTFEYGIMAYTKPMFYLDLNKLFNEM